MPEDPEEALAAAEADAARNFPIPKDPARAQALYEELLAALPDRFPQANDQSPAYTAYMRHLFKVNEVASPPKPAAPPAGLPWREEIQVEADRKALAALLQQHPQESERAKQLIDARLAFEDELLDKHGRPDPGAYAEADADRAAEQDGWTQAEIEQGRAFKKAFGLTSLQGEEFRLEIREAIRPWAGKELPSSDDLDLDELWGAEVDTNIEAVARVRTTLQRQFPRQWQKVIPYLGIATVVNALAKVGHLAKR